MNTKKGQLTLKPKTCSFECFRCRFDTGKAQTNNELSWSYYTTLCRGEASVIGYIISSLANLGDEDAKRALSFVTSDFRRIEREFKQRFNVECIEAANVKKDLGISDYAIEDNTLKIGNFRLQKVQFTLYPNNIPNLALLAMFGNERTSLGHFTTPSSKVLTFSYRIDRLVDYS